jgi:3-oxoadipate enol-lactonase
MPIANVNGIDIHYELDGEADETLVLVNGLADDLETWLLQMPDFLAAGFSILRFDNRGVGRSEKPVGPYTTSLFAEDTRALVDHLDIDRFHLLGVSMGGMIAQEFAIRWSSRLSSLTLACTYAAPGPFCGRMYSLWADVAAFAGVSTVMRDVALWAFTPEFFETRPEDAAEFDTAMQMITQPVPAYLAQLWSIRHHDASDRIGSITCPTLVVAGAQDILIPVELSKRLQAAIPGSEWATTPGGHACIWEHPTEFNHCVIEFLDKHRRQQ